MSASVSRADFDTALRLGRPPSVVKLYPHSQALIVSGKVIDRAMLRKGQAIALAANCRSHLVLRGVLAAAQRANAAVILEIAKSEATYCPTTFYNLTCQADQVMNELGITVPVAIHADHYGIKSAADLEAAKVELPSMFEAGITSVAIDASHLPDDENALANIALAPYLPTWAGYETEVGEIKGKAGLSTPEEALFLIQALNAHGIHPDWIALNNGTTHGIEASDAGIQVELTAQIHNALAPYKLSGAQHGTSGNSSERLREIAQKTRTTKANVATALQMVGWGVKVNEYGNAFLNADGTFQKESGGIPTELWQAMVAHAAKGGLKAGDYKKLNLPFESRIRALPRAMREASSKAVEDFVYDLLVHVFNAKDTADLAIAAILEAGSYDLGAKVGRVEDPAAWTEAEIRRKAALVHGDKGPSGDFDD